MKSLSNTSISNLKSKISKGNYVLLFSAPWCPDCRFLDPFLDEIETDFPQYDFLKINIDDNKDLANELDVMGIPSFVVFSNGKEIGRLVNKNRKTKAEVESFLNSLKEVNQ